MSKTNQVLKALQNGDELTAAQIRSRFSVGNPHDVIHVLRENGYAIYLNKRKNSKGQVMQKYRLGTPTRKIVAAGIAALGIEAAGLV
jgi:predicted transcriptional regulator